MADALSRASLQHTGKSSTENDVQIHVDCVVGQIPVSKQKWVEFADATASDSVLQEVICKINSPEDETLPSLYQHFRDELSIIDGVLLKGSRIVVPSTMRQLMTELVHEGHMGIEKCKRRARDVMYWLYMNRDVETRVQRCEICQQHRYKQQKEPLLPHFKPCEPWWKVGADLFQLNGKDYMVVMDYYSNYPEFALLTDTSAKHVISHLKTIFARHGIPVTLVSDNGPQFCKAVWI